MSKHKTHVTNLSSMRSRKPVDAILSDLLTEVFKGTSGPVLIAVGGPGGTGKSTLSKRLAKTLPDAMSIRLDDYKTPRQIRQGKNLFGAHPDANRMDLIRDHLGKLKEKQSIKKPVYDSRTGQADETITVRPGEFVVLDGEISTYAELREFIDFAIFIDSDWTTQLNTRISRDISARGYSREKAIATFLQSNLREFTKYGAESKKWADVHLYSHDDYHLEIESVSKAVFDRFHNLLEQYLATVDLSGLVIAITTPFDETREIDRQAFIKHLEYLAHHGVKRILVGGTTGEFFSLLPEERRMLLTLARRYFPGVVMFQVGSDSLKMTLRAVGWAEKYGADAIVCLPPYYFTGVPRQGLCEYFESIASATELPLILYNFPKHTQNSLDAELLRSVSHFGIKDSSADLELINSTPRYYLGGDRKIIECFDRDGYGFVSGSANAHPETYVAMEKACRERDNETAAKLQAEISRLVDKYNLNLIPNVKRILNRRLPDYPPFVRLPLK